MSVNQQIDIILEDILEIEGVSGVLATETSGQVIAARMPTIYDYETLGQASKKAVEILVNIQLLGPNFEEIIIYFQDVRLIVKDLRTGFLMIMSLPTISVPLLNLMTNYSRKRITEILSFSEKNQNESIKNVE